MKDLSRKGVEHYFEMASWRWPEEGLGDTGSSIFTQAVLEQNKRKTCNEAVRWTLSVSSSLSAWVGSLALLHLFWVTSSKYFMAQSLVRHLNLDG